MLGCGLPQGATGHNIGRTAALEAGFDVPGVTVNRYCGSGLTAASMIASRIAMGEIACGIAGGVESISLVQMGIAVDGFFYAPLQARMPAVWWTMNETADFVAKKYGISREALDQYAGAPQRVRAHRPRHPPRRLSPSADQRGYTPRRRGSDQRLGHHQPPP